MKRDIALDILKGFCVLSMVVHHSIDYFPESYIQIRYVRFVSAAFLLMAGFVSTHIYFTKYDVDKDSKKICGRLIWRGIKICLIALIINLALNIILPARSSHIKLDLIDTFYYLLSGVDYTLVSFDLLVAIGYTLICSGFLIFVFKNNKIPFVVIALLLILYCSLFHYSQDKASYYLRYCSIGLLGAALGLISRERLIHWLNNLSNILCLYIVHIILVINIELVYPLYVINGVRL